VQVEQAVAVQLAEMEAIQFLAPLRQQVVAVVVVVRRTLTTEMQAVQVAVVVHTAQAQVVLVRLDKETMAVRF
jgi:hypothetical protein